MEKILEESIEKDEHARAESGTALERDGNQTSSPREEASGKVRVA
jgi:hypothetical protein